MGFEYHPLVGPTAEIVSGRHPIGHSGTSLKIRGANEKTANWRLVLQAGRVGHVPVRVFEYHPLVGPTAEFNPGIHPIGQLWHLTENSRRKRKNRHDGVVSYRNMAGRVGFEYHPLVGPMAEFDPGMHPIGSPYTLQNLLRDEKRTRQCRVPTETWRGGWDLNPRLSLTPALT